MKVIDISKKKGAHWDRVADYLLDPDVIRIFKPNANVKSEKSDLK